jgi:nucleoside-diphosphate-sugar epimerase
METHSRKRVLITGAAGRLGRILSEDLAEKYDLTLLSDVPVADVDFEIIDVARERRRLRQVMDGHDCVIHLAYTEEDENTTVNFSMAKNVFVSATDVSPVPRVVFASSIHAVGAYLNWGTAPLCHIASGRLDKVSRRYLPSIAPHQPPSPDGLYGAMKCYVEHLCAVYAARGMEVVVLRLGGVRQDDRIEPEPGYRSFWLSRRDCSRLFERAIDAQLKSHYVCVFGVSNNTYRVHDISAAREQLGFEPLDDAEVLITTKAGT